ncbi:MAG: hypothetical protein JWM90_531 [Thermoleophilia bacterium]|nr:hypothetical protein [Thermoleophilia bacterium]
MSTNGARLPTLRQMESTTTDLVLVAAMLALFVVFGVAMLAVALRYGPKRGTWNQPAAAFRRPGRFTFRGMYAVAIVHVLLGIIVTVAVPGAGIGILLVLIFTGCFYVLCAHSFALASGIQRRRS